MQHKSAILRFALDNPDNIGMLNEEEKDERSVARDVDSSTKLTIISQFKQFLIPYKPIFAALKIFRSIYESNEVWWYVCR